MFLQPSKFLSVHQIDSSALGLTTQLLPGLPLSFCLNCPVAPRNLQLCCMILAQRRVHCLFPTPVYRCAFFSCCCLLSHWQVCAILVSCHRLQYLLYNFGVNARTLRVVGSTSAVGVILWYCEWLNYYYYGFPGQCATPIRCRILFMQHVLILVQCSNSGAGAARLVQSWWIHLV